MNSTYKSVTRITASRKVSTRLLKEEIKTAVRDVQFWWLHLPTQREFSAELTALAKALRSSAETNVCRRERTILMSVTLGLPLDTRDLIALAGIFIRSGSPVEKEITAI